MITSCKKDYPAEFYEAENTSRFTFPSANSVLLQNNTYQLSWIGFEEEEMGLFLYQNDDLVLTISSKEQNTGNYTWKVPINITANSNYRLKIQSLSGNFSEFYSANFNIASDSSLPFISPEPFVDDNSFVLGTILNIAYTSNVDKKIGVDLFLDNQKVATIADSTTNNNFLWSIPTNLPTSSNYRLYFYVKNQTDINAYSGYFRLSDVNSKNLVKNGNFNTPNFWIISNPNANFKERWFINNNLPEGEAQLSSLLTSGSISQNIDVVIGEQYVVSYELKRLGGYFGGVRTSEAFNIIAGITCFMGNSAGAKRIEAGHYTDTITANSTQIRFTVNINNQASPKSGLIGVLDNVVVTPLN